MVEGVEGEEGELGVSSGQPGLPSLTWGPGGVRWRAGLGEDADPLGTCWLSGAWAASEFMTPNFCLFSSTGCSQMWPFVSLGFGL